MYVCKKYKIINNVVFLWCDRLNEVLVGYGINGVGFESILYIRFV